MNGNAVKFRRTVEKHRIVCLDTAPLIYFIEDIAPYANLLERLIERFQQNLLAAVVV